MTTQNKKLTAFLVSLALCILLFYAATSLHLEIDELYLLFGAAAAGILRVCMGTVTLAGLFLKNRTGYAVFAVTDIVLALMTVARLPELVNQCHSQFLMLLCIRTQKVIKHIFGNLLYDLREFR